MRFMRRMMCKPITATGIASQGQNKSHPATAEPIHNATITMAKK